MVKKMIDGAANTEFNSPQQALEAIGYIAGTVGALLNVCPIFAKFPPSPNGDVIPLLLSESGGPNTIEATPAIRPAKR